MVEVFYCRYLSPPCGAVLDSQQIIKSEVEDQGAAAASLPHLSSQVLKQGPSAPLVRVNFMRHGLYALWLPGRSWLSGVNLA